jgi:uncharacterized protein
MQELNIHDTQKGLITTSTGRIISLTDPNPQEIDMDDIIDALTNICRFGGQMRQFYSVAQHSVLVYRLAPPELEKEAILHDASEAYLGDVISPLKHILGEPYKKLERRFTELIFECYGADINKLEEVKKYDMLAVEIEDIYLRKPKTPEAIKKQWYDLMIEPSKIALRDVWTPNEADYELRFVLQNIFNKNKLQSYETTQ